MKTSLALNSKVLELYKIVDGNFPEQYPKVIQLAEVDDCVSIHHGEWNISTDYNKTLFVGPEKLWSEIDNYLKEIEKFILNSIKAAPKETNSKYHIWKCDDGFMYLGPFDKKGFNWITFITKTRYVVVGHHYRNPARERELNIGIANGDIIPVNENYFNFIVEEVACRIRTIKKLIISLYSPY